MLRRTFFYLTLWIAVAWAIPGRAQGFELDPTNAALIRVHVLAPNGSSGLGTVVYEVLNQLWPEPMRNLDFSLWALVSGQLVRVHQRQAGFLESGQGIVTDNLPRPFVIGRMVVCFSYAFKGRKVNVVDFYTNENLLSSHGYSGQMQKFRESLKQVDGPNDLCKLMPGTAAQFM